MSTNSPCEVCGARTTIQYNNDCYTSVLLSHILIAGATICKHCIDEFMTKHVRIATSYPKKRGRTPRIEVINWTFTKGDHIRDEDD